MSPLLSASPQCVFCSTSTFYFVSATYNFHRFERDTASNCINGYLLTPFLYTLASRFSILIVFLAKNLLLILREHSFYVERMYQIFFGCHAFLIVALLCASLGFSAYIETEDPLFDRFMVLFTIPILVVLVARKCLPLT